MEFSLLQYLSFPPILRGALVILTSSLTFPLVGVLVLRLHLVPYRFMLMHSSLLGSALGLAFNMNPLVVGFLTNGLVITGVGLGEQSRGFFQKQSDPARASHMVSFFMVFTIGLAFAIIYRYQVPALEALGLLWGNVYALTPQEAWITGLFGLGILIVVLLVFPWIRALLFNREIAYTLGVPVRLLSLGILYGVGFTIHLAMSLIGALMLDSLLILPAMIAGYTSRSAKGLFIHSSLWGVAIGVLGFILSLYLDIPASSGLTLTGAVFLGICLLITSRKKRRIVQKSY